MSIEETIYLLVQIFEFAAQLGSAANYHLQGDLHIDIALCGIKGRALQFDPSSRFRPMLQDYVTNAEEISYSENFTKEQLITQARELSLVPAIRIFQRFNWHPSQKLIRGIQAELPPI